MVKAQKAGQIPIKRYGTAQPRYREFALQQKGAKCEECGYCKLEGVLEVHHLDLNRRNNKIENLKVLCPTCHQEIHFLSNTGRYHRKLETQQGS
jgi:5-methylcytosine-specific restriction endonuclease McrA